MKKILKDLRTYYVIALIVIFLYPPIEEVYSRGTNEFLGWHFIDSVGGYVHINIPYITVELFIVSVIYFIYRKKS